MNIFNILDNILKLKSKDQYTEHIESSDFSKVYNMFMIQRWLSMCTFPDVIKVLSENQEYLDNIKSKELHYNILLKIMPQHKNCFLKYIK